MERRNPSTGNVRIPLLFGILLGLIGLIIFTLLSRNTEEGRSSGSPARARNVLLISMDTLRPDHLSCYGYDKDTSPNLDALAGKSHLFTRAYTTMPTTVPAHASLMTSLYPKQLAVQRNQEKLPQEALTLAEILRGRGMATAAFVSSAVLHRSFGLDQGFQVYSDTMMEKRGGETVSEAIAWLEENGDKPFFLFVHLYDPHYTYSAPEAFRASFGVRAKVLPPESVFVAHPEIFTPEVNAQVIAAYDAEIAYADSEVGRLIQTLEGMKIDDKTAVVFLSDHGESLDELLDRYGYAYDHGEFLYEHQLRIPLIIHPPGETEGGIHDEMSTILDVEPTILDLLGLPPLEPSMGISLLPVLEGGSIPERAVFSDRRAFEEVPKPFLEGEARTVVMRDWRYIYAPKRAIELFDHKDDPKETRNLLDEQEKVAKELQALINEWAERNRPLYGPAKVMTDPDMLRTLKELGYGK